MKLNNIFNGLVTMVIILACGETIRQEIKENHPKIYQQYLKERINMPWYKKIWYLK
jgi:hypothetical protein